MWRRRSSREADAPSSSGTISAPPDARSSRCASTSIREWRFPSTGIRAKRSSMSSKARSSMRSRASRRSRSRPATSCSSRPERSTRRRTSAAATGPSSPPTSSKKESRSSNWSSERRRATRATSMTQDDTTACVNSAADPLSLLWTQGYSIAELWGRGEPVTRGTSRVDAAHLLLWGILSIVEYQVSKGAGHRYLRERLWAGDWIAIGNLEPKASEARLCRVEVRPQGLGHRRRNDQIYRGPDRSCAIRRPQIMGWQFWTIRRIVVQKQGWRAQPGLADDSRGMAPTGRGGNRVAYRLLHRLHARRRRRRLSRRTLRRVRVGHLCEPDRVPGAVFWVPVGGLVARGVGEQATLRRVSRAIARRKRRATQASGPRDTQAQRELRGAQQRP